MPNVLNALIALEVWKLPHTFTAILLIIDLLLQRFQTKITEQTPRKIRVKMKENKCNKTFSIDHFKRIFLFKLQPVILD